MCMSAWELLTQFCVLRNKNQLGSLEEEIEKRTLGKGNMRRDRKERLGPQCTLHQLEYDS